jgi:hypothetical protein
MKPYLIYKDHRMAPKVKMVSRSKGKGRKKRSKRVSK